MPHSKKIFLLAALLSVAISSCCECQEPPGQQPFEIREFSIRNLNNSGSFPLVSKAESLNRHSFGLALVFPKRDDKQIVLKDVYPATPFVPICCQKGEPAQWAIEYLRIYTVYDFDTSRLAGADVTDYFQIVSSGSHSLFYNSLNEMETGVFHNSFDANGNYILPILLMTSPSDAAKVGFRIVMKFWYHDEEFEGVSDSVILQ